MKQIPVNVLDKVKHSLNETNAPQYFFQYWEFQGSIDNDVLLESFYACYSQLEKLQVELAYKDGGYSYISKAYKNKYVRVETKRNLHEELIDVMEHQSKSIIEKSGYPPLLLVHIQSDKEASIVLLMVNHIYADAVSGYCFFENLVRSYNAVLRGDEKPNFDLQTVSDEDFLKELKSDFTFLQKLQYVKQLIKHIRASLYYKSEKNKITKIYSEQTDVETVYYSNYTISRTSISTSKYGLNTIISSAILKAFLNLKGDKINNTASAAMPINIRNASQKLFGNYVNSLSIKVENNPSLEQVKSIVQQRVDEFKSPLRRVASYSLISILGKKKTQAELLEVFRGLSLKHHFYISNYGQYNFNDDKDLIFEGCELTNAGGFNFPLQASYGLIFTIVPTKNSVTVSIASSPIIMSSEDVSEFWNLFSNYVCE